MAIFGELKVNFDEIAIFDIIDWFFIIDYIKLRSPNVNTFN